MGGRRQERMHMPALPSHACAAAGCAVHALKGVPLPAAPVHRLTLLPSPLSLLQLLRGGCLDLVHHLALWPGPRQGECCRLWERLCSVV